MDIGGQDPVEPRAIGPGPSLEWLEIAALVIDDGYQRPLGAKNWKAIRRIATEFDWALFTPVVCAPKVGGGYYLIDGQHRAHGAALAGLAKVPALVVEIPRDRQATAFAAINTRRTAVSQFHLLRAALLAGEPMAVAAARAVAAAGCRIMTYQPTSTSRLPGRIFCVGMVLEHVRAGRADLVTKVLTAIRGSARGDALDLYQARILKPLLAMLADEPPLPLALLTRFITETDLIRARNTVGDLRARPEYTRLSDYQLARRAFAALLHRFVASAARAA